MNKIKLHYLVGDVHLGGHDVYRVAKNNKLMLDATNAFDLTIVCDDDRLGNISFDDYLKTDNINKCDAIVFNCGNYRFNTPKEQQLLENAVKNGAGFIFLHGDHPCYWVEAGMKPWTELEKMAMLMWREPTTHGDFANHRISVQNPSHTIMQGIEDFDTRDEIFCTMKNIHNVPCEILATAYSNPNVISRHGLSGTGRNEGVIMVGTYGKGRTYNQALGHVWPYYTGHGLYENTMASFSARELRKIFVRGCEWAATGNVVKTLGYNGEGRLL